MRFFEPFLYNVETYFLEVNLFLCTSVGYAQRRFTCRDSHSVIGFASKFCLSELAKAKCAISREFFTILKNISNMFKYISHSHYSLKDYAAAR
jgi:hypothetical protein